MGHFLSALGASKVSVTLMSIAVFVTAFGCFVSVFALESVLLWMVCLCRCVVHVVGGSVVLVLFDLRLRCSFARPDRVAIRLHCAAVRDLNRLY